MSILKMQFNGNPNIGLYGYCNNKFCLLGTEISDEKAKLVESVLKVPVHKITMCGTSLIGAFVTGNSKTILIPKIAFDYEKKKLDELGIKYMMVETRLDALGNNVLCNDKGCIVNPDFNEDERKQIENALGVKSQAMLICELEIVGSLAALTTKGCIVHRDILPQEKKILDKALGLKSVPSTLNMGSPYIRSAILCNDNGMVVGELSGGPELVNAEDGLGYLNQDKPEKKPAKKAASTAVKKPRKTPAKKPAKGRKIIKPKKE